jgi:fido (protein-threonine AMPylation protein)
MLHLPKEVVWDPEKTDWPQAAVDVSLQVQSLAHDPPEPSIFTDFCTRQKALVVYDSNRMEGTFPAEHIAGETVALLSNMFSSPTTAVPEMTAIGNSEGGRDANSASSHLQLKQHAKATLLDDPLRDSLSVERICVVQGSGGNPEWNSEGGRDANSASSRLQLKQHAKATRYLLDDHLRDSLSVELICAVHGIMMQDSDMQSIGKIRSDPVFAGGHVFLEAKNVRPALENLCRNFNEDNRRHPIQRASFLLYELITIHPFMNGNGRLCRLLLAWSLVRDGLPFPIALSSNHKATRRHYLHAIERARGNIVGVQQTLAHLNVLIIVSLHRSMKNLATAVRLSSETAYRPIDDENA